MDINDINKGVKPNDDIDAKKARDEAIELIETYFNLDPVWELASGKKDYDLAEKQTNICIDKIIANTYERNKEYWIRTKRELAKFTKDAKK